MTVGVTEEPTEVQTHEGRDYVEQRKEAPEAIEPRRADVASDSSRAPVVPDDSSDSSSHRTVDVVATAYTAFCDTGCIGITATGVDVRDTIYHEGKRVIAVDPDVIPLGSDVTLTLPDGSTIEATANDTGGAIVGNRIDLLVGSRDKAIRFGKQPVQVEIH